MTVHGGFLTRLIKKILARNDLWKGTKLKVLYIRGRDNMADYDEFRHVITIYHYLRKEKCNLGVRGTIGRCHICRKCFRDESEAVIDIINHELYHAINRNRDKRLWMMEAAMTIPFQFIRREILKDRFDFIQGIMNVIWRLLMFPFRLYVRHCVEDDLASDFAKINAGRINRIAWNIANSSTVSFMDGVKWFPTEIEAKETMRRMSVENRIKDLKRARRSKETVMKGYDGVAVCM
jgi:hypothetical protein